MTLAVYALCVMCVSVCLCMVCVSVCVCLWVFKEEMDMCAYESQTSCTFRKITLLRRSSGHQKVAGSIPGSSKPLLA